MVDRHDPHLSYDVDRDVRDWTSLVDRIQRGTPGGLFWPLVGPRRSGKSWALAAVHQRLGDRARCLDLKDFETLPDPDREFVLVDEPGKFLFVPATHAPDRSRRPDPDRIANFLAWCRRLRDRPCRTLIAMSPAEWLALARHPGARVDERDLQPHLRPLAVDQALRIARHDSARALLQQLRDRHPDWLRNPFLVTCLLAYADESPGDRELPEFLADLREHLNDPSRWDYVSWVFHEGLDDATRDVLRRVSRSETTDPQILGLLRTGGLVDSTPTIRDPMLADHLPPPLRIHHISDIHVGPKAAQRVQVTGSDPLPTRLGTAAGQGPVRDAYAAHVRQCGAEHSAPHLLVVSGDLTETGQPAEYEGARALLATLAESLQPHPHLSDRDPRVLVVGGNHDVAWNETRGHAGARRRHLDFARYFFDYPRPRLEEPPDARPLTVQRYAAAGIEFVLLGSAEHGGELDETLITVLDTARQQALDAGRTEPAETAERLRARLGRLDPGLVHHADLDRLRQHRWREPLRIAVLHHPVSPLPAQPDITAYTGLLNAGAVKDALIDRGFTLVLHGHMHSQWFGEETWPGHRRGRRTLRIAAAPSLGSREVSEQHGFNEIIVSFEGTSQRVEVRGWVRDGDSFKPRSGIAEFAVDLPE